MSAQIVAFVVGITIFVSYLTYVIIKVGIPPSISDSWYSLNKTPLFTLFIWGTAFSMMVASSTDLMVLSGISLCFVGAAPAFKEDMVKKVHFTGTLISGAFALLSIGIEWDRSYFIYTSIWFIALFYALDFKNKMLWSELLIFLLVFVTIGLSFLCRD